MSAGSPTSPGLLGTAVRATRAQEDEIRGMLDRGVPHATIAAAVDCTIARVQHVAGIPSQRLHSGGQRQKPPPLPLDDLLAAGHAHPDADVNRLAHRIVTDLKALRDRLGLAP